MKRLFLSLVLVMGMSPMARSLDAESLSEVGLGLGGIAYWNSPAFANALWNGGTWLEFGPREWGKNVFLENNPQFDANGFPQYLNPDRKLRAIFYALHANPSPRPQNWPDRTTLAKGKVVVTWKGEADIRANGGTYLAAESSGDPTGNLVNGRRVYRFSGASRLDSIVVESIKRSNPLKDIKVWLSDPADPEKVSLENKMFHPTYLARLADAPWAFLRFMDWNDSNGSPQRDWVDRRKPDHAFMTGVLNRRSPAEGFPGDRGTGVAFEHMVALCNAAERDMWINVPHLATDDFVRRLAQLIRYGSDGSQPYSGMISNPVHPGLARGRRVFVEYSNEIWSNGGSFPQGNWAEAQGKTLGISKAQFNARRFCQIWRIFQEVFAGETERVVRVAAIWTGQEGYTKEFLNEVAAYGPTLKPATTPDLIAPTTYFGNGMQDWVYARAKEQAGTSDPWFLTTKVYTNGGIARPVSVGANDPYWQGTNLTRHLTEAFTEWRRRLLSESTQRGGGPDATGVGGGFDYSLVTAISNAFGTHKPIVSYEGGPSIYTDYLDSGRPEDAGVTTFMELLNRHADFTEMYRIHLNLAKAKGLNTHGVFVDLGTWGRYGQWGHLEYLAQPPKEAVKWRFVTEWPAEVVGVRPVRLPKGTVPGFATPAKMNAVRCGESFSYDLVSTGGNGGLKVTVISALLRPGVTVVSAPRGLRVMGAATAPGENLVLARVQDEDGDPAWRTFRFLSVGGPGTLLECDFTGEDPAQDMPWTNVYVLQSGISFSGWNHGEGNQPQKGADALVWSQNMPADEKASTLELAVGENEFWGFTLSSGSPVNLSGAEVRLTLRRIDYNAPRSYAVLVRLKPAGETRQVFDTGRFTDMTDREFAFRLPADPAFERVSGSVEFRVVGYLGQWGGHKTSLRAFKITQPGVR